jgi:small lipoprotein (TIGR04454 family)
MKKNTFLILALFAALTLSNCNKEVVSAAECEPAIDKAFENLMKELRPEEVQQIEANKGVLKTGLMKPCTEGKVDVKCLQTATNLGALTACKK